MSKYGMSIGIWKLEVNGTSFDLHPKKGDNYKLLEIMQSSGKNKTQLFAKFSLFVRDLIARDYPFENDEEKEELEQIIEYNILHLLQETMVAFRWTTREQLKSMEGDELKNLIGEN